MSNISHNATSFDGLLNIDTETLYVINLVCASLSIVPVCMALLYKLYFIFSMFSISSIISILYSAIILKDNSKNAQSLRVFSVLNSVSGVIVALTIGIETGLYRSIFGLLRIVWLITVVTASSSYAFFQTEFGASFLPNDVTLITLVSSAFLLLMALIFNKLKCCRDLSNKSVFPEILLVLGAFVLRFDVDIEKLLNVSFGMSIWNVCCWCAGVILIIDTKCKKKKNNREYDVEVSE